MPPASYPPRTPPQATQRDITSADSSYINNSGIRIVPYSPPRPLDDTPSHRSSVCSNINDDDDDNDHDDVDVDDGDADYSANIVIEGETQLEDSEEDTTQHYDDTVNLHPGGQFRMNHANHSIVNGSGDEHEVDHSFAFSDDMDAPLAHENEIAKNSSFRLNNANDQTAMLADETLPSELHHDMSSFGGPQGSVQVSGSTITASASTPAPAIATDVNRNRGSYAWDDSVSSPNLALAHGDPPGSSSSLSSFGSSTIEHSGPERVHTPTPNAALTLALAQDHDQSQAQAELSVLDGVKTPTQSHIQSSSYFPAVYQTPKQQPLPKKQQSPQAKKQLSPQAKKQLSPQTKATKEPAPAPVPESTYQTPKTRPRQNSNLLPGNGRKRRNLLKISSDGKTFSLAPLSPSTAASEYAPAPLYTPSKLQQNATPSSSNSNARLPFSSISPRPLPPAPSPSNATTQNAATISDVSGAVTAAASASAAAPRESQPTVSEPTFVTAPEPTTVITESPSVTPAVSLDESPKATVPPAPATAPISLSGSNSTSGPGSGPGTSTTGSRPITIPSSGSVSSITLTTPSIRTISATANSIFNSTLSSSPPSTIRPVFDSSRLSSGAYSSTTATTRSASSFRHRLSSDTFVDPRSSAVTSATTESYLLSPQQAESYYGSTKIPNRYSSSFLDVFKGKDPILETDPEPELDFTSSLSTSLPTESWASRMVGGLRQVPITTEDYKAPIEDSKVSRHSNISPITIARYSPDSHLTLRSATLHPSPTFDRCATTLDDDKNTIRNRSSISSQNKLSLHLPLNHDNSDLDLHDESRDKLEENELVLPNLNVKPSFQSETTLSETSNYKVYARSISPVVPEDEDDDHHHIAHDDSASIAPSLDSNTNVQILGLSSPVASISHSALDDRDAVHGASFVTFSEEDDEEEANFVVHNVSDVPSASPDTSLVQSLPENHPQSLPVPARLQSEFSQESLRVAPLRPLSKVFATDSRPLSSASSDSNVTLRLAPSQGSLDSAFSFDNVESLVATPAALYLHRASVLDLPAAAYNTNTASAYNTASADNSFTDSGSPMSNSFNNSWDGYAGSSSAGPIAPMQAYPHKWSDQLSTVMSESEPASSAPHSRSNSLGSFGNSNNGGSRRNTGYASSSHSRHLPSISSSIAGNPDSSNTRTSSGSWSHTRSNSASVDRPQGAYHRSVGSTVIQHVDEHGDGLGELNTLHSRPSRSRLGSMFTVSDRNLHSSSSSRANSMTVASLPTWAKLYYGRGERHFLPSTSEDNETPENRPHHGHTRSYSADFFGRLKRPLTGTQRPVSMDGNSVANGAENHHHQPGHVRNFSIRAQIRKQTSSIWSPHLRQDRNAIMSRYSSVWDPPSVVWSSGSSILNRRNVQVVSFVLGFIFPFAWMIAAFLPLPTLTFQSKMMEEGRSSNENLSGSEADAGPEVLPAPPRTAEAYELRMLEAARWWRRLNRYMSFVGLLVIGAVVALIVVGVQ